MFTGTLQMKRAEATAKSQAAGATVGSSVTGSTHILVAGPGAGSKMSAAKAKGVEVWTEQQFFDALGGRESASSSSAPAPKKGAAGKAPAPPAKQPPAAAKKGNASAPPAEQPAAKKARGKAKAGPEEPPEPPPSPPPKAPASTVSTPGGGGTPGGGRRVDRSVPGAGDWRVIDEWAIKLMQTNIGDGSNNNKFYIIQALEQSSGCALWTRWGRVGEEGQSSLEKFPSSDGVTKAFQKKFKDKTKNDWSSRQSGTFVKHDGKYQVSPIHAVPP